MGELLLAAGKPDEAGRYFEAAVAKLSTLRPTVARQRILEKVQQIQASLGKPS